MDSRSSFDKRQYLPYSLMFEYVLASFNSPQLLEPVASAQDKRTSSLRRFTLPSKVSFIFFIKNKQHPASFRSLIRSSCWTGLFSPLCLAGCLKLVHSKNLPYLLSCTNFLCRYLFIPGVYELFDDICLMAWLTTKNLIGPSQGICQLAKYLLCFGGA